MRERVSRDKKTTTEVSIPSLKNPVRGFGLDSPYTAPRVVPDVQPLNKPPGHHISRISVRPQAKLTVNQPGDIFEQEADRVAQQVMGKLGQPGNSPGIQREQMPEEEEELQMKPLASNITSLVQRQEMPEEEELQMKPLEITTLQRQEAPEDEEELQMKPMLQRQANAEMAAAPDLETSINQARGGGQAMADNIREPMEQAFGADFSGVKVHTDGQSDQLNRSIQARAFTTGQDVFFRQGEYNPGSRGGQELLAHELTHVVQQSGGAVMRSAKPGATIKTNQALNITPGKEGEREIQRTMKEWEKRDLRDAFEDVRVIDWQSLEDKTYTEAFHILLKQRSDMRKREYELKSIGSGRSEGEGQHPIMTEALKIINDMALRSKKITVETIKQRLGDKIEEYFKPKLPPGCLTTIRVKQKNGKILQDVELDGLDPIAHQIISVKAQRKALNEQRDRAMWKQIVKTLKDGGVLTVNGVDHELPEKLLSVEPGWCGISFDDSVEGSQVWAQIDQLVTEPQPQEAPEDEELQMSPMVQRQAGAQMAAAPDLEASINQARGGGQPLAENIRQPMEQAFGADFSGVKVHTDGQSDLLNRSIQARAFTTGQDVFFRQGEYNPGSRGGQELLAHELTHVVQQSGGEVMRSALLPEQLQPTLKIEKQIVQKNNNDTDSDEESSSEESMDTGSVYDPTSDQEYDDQQDIIDDKTPEWEATIPYRTHQTTTDGNTKYWTPESGIVDFENPSNDGRPVTCAKTVNITQDISQIPGVNKTYEGNKPKASRSSHNTVANIIHEQKAPSQYKSNSPPGYTWHHNANEVGRMDLLDRVEHAHIKHKGGYSEWGS